MDQAKYLEMVKRNPYTLEHIENPSEDIMLCLLYTSDAADE